MTSAKPDRPPVRSLYKIYGALVLLLVITALGPVIPIGNVGHFILAFGISIIKTVLIVAIFMEVKYEKGLVHIFAGAGLIWLILLFLFTFADFIARS